jgi:thiamine-monophosphate kinase
MKREVQRKVQVEVQLVEKISRALHPRNSFRRSRVSRSSVRLDIGDDAAVLKPSPNSEWVVSCDAFVEDIHFRISTHPADSVGYKSLMRATSDLAAMGASPRYYLLTLALPSERTGRWLNEFLPGMARASRELRIRAVGGDTTRNSKISLSLTVIGEAKPGRTISRSGARPGDLIYVSGTLGRAQLGLELTLAGYARTRSVRDAVAPHLYPRARVELGAWLAQHKIPSAMIDLSDGLSTDLARLCTASRVGAQIRADQLPFVTITPAARKLLRPTRIDPQQAALHSGDDYELLFTIPPRHVSKLRRAPGARTLHHIGEITRTHSPSITLVDTSGHSSPFYPAGWDSFR